MKTIVHRSMAVGTFFGLLGLTWTFYAPQLGHLQRLCDLLVVAPRRKTLAQLALLELDGVDPSNLADFFRISPWDPDDLRVPMIVALMQYLKDHQTNPRLPLFLILDDSLTQKDKGTRHLEGVDWFFDHKSQRTIQASNHLSLSLRWGDFYFPLGERLFLRQSTIRRRNRRRAKEERLSYKSKLKLAREMLEQVSPYLPKEVKVYVLFDSWYTSAELVRWIRKQSWQVIAGIKSNRKVSFKDKDSKKARWKKVSAWHNDFKGRPYQRVGLGLANGKRRTYYVRSVSGCLKDVSGAVRVLISQKGPGRATPRYFLSTDLSLSAQQILKHYQNRWQIESDYWQVKMHLGLGDFRLQSHEAIGKWYSVVYLVLAYLYWRKYEHQRATGTKLSLSEVIQAIRNQHQRECLRQACLEMASGTPLEEVLQRYVGEDVLLVG